MLNMITCAVILVFFSGMLQPGSAGPKRPKIISLHIRSDIRYRFCTTFVTSRMVNADDKPRVAFFEVVLSSRALISNFSLEINDTVYPGVVEKRKFGKEQEMRKGPRNKPIYTSLFRVKVNMTPGAIVKFRLTFHEMLQRKLGHYNHNVYLFFRQKQVVKNLLIETFIDEPRSITGLKYAVLNKDMISHQAFEHLNGKVTKKHKAGTGTAYIRYNITKIKSRKLMSTAFTVQYDVRRGYDAGDILAQNGYVIHFFAPEKIRRIPKDIVFVLQIKSSACRGESLKELEKAMEEMLNHLSDEDRFGVVLSKDTQLSDLLDVTEDNKKAVQNMLRSVTCDLSTPIYSHASNLIAVSLQLLENNANVSSYRQRLLLFLTDRPIFWKSSFKEEVEKGKKAKIPIFMVAYGERPNYYFLWRMSYKSDSQLRMVLQKAVPLETFYNEISNILMSELIFSYTGTANVTHSENGRYRYHEGSENVVFRHLFNGSESLREASVSGVSADGIKNLTRANIITGKLRKLEGFLSGEELDMWFQTFWTYLTLRKLRTEAYMSENKTEKVSLIREARKLAIKRNFLTHWTAMVIRAPAIYSEAVVDSDQPDKILKPIYSRGGHGGGFGDPHFTVKIKGLNHPVCFDTDSRPDDVINLVQDEEQKIFIQASLIRGKTVKKKTGKYKTYISKIVIEMPSLFCTITPHSIAVDSQVLTWRKRNLMVTKAIINNLSRKRLLIKYKSGIEILVKRQLSRGRPHKVDYLDFFVVNGTAFSKTTTGLLGHMLHENAAITSTWITDQNRIKARIQLSKNGSTPFIGTLNNRNDINGRLKPCWVVWKYGAALIHGRYSDYLLDRLHTEPSGIRIL